MPHTRRFFFLLSIGAFVLLSAALCAAQSVGKAAELAVVYLDGTVELLVSSQWKALEVGDTVAPDATVRLAKDSSMQLSRTGLTLSFLTPGSFSVADILSRNAKASATGLASALGKTARALTGTGQKVQKTGTLGGVRASEVAKPKETLWVDELEEIRTRVKALFAEEKFAEAARVLEQTQEEGLTDEENEEVSYLLASADYARGETAHAWKAVAEQDPAPASKFYAGILLMKAQLLMEGYSFPQALELLQKLTGPTVVPEVAQQALLLAGLCHRAQGNEQAARDAWNKGIALLPGSETESLIKETMAQ